MSEPIPPEQSCRGKSWLDLPPPPFLGDMAGVFCQWCGEEGHEAEEGVDWQGKPYGCLKLQQAFQAVRDEECECPEPPPPLDRRYVATARDKLRAVLKARKMSKALAADLWTVLRELEWVR